MRPQSVDGMNENLGIEMSADSSNDAFCHVSEFSGVSWTMGWFWTEALRQDRSLETKTKPKIWLSFRDNSSKTNEDSSGRVDIHSFEDITKARATISD